MIETRERKKNNVKASFSSTKFKTKPKREEEVNKFRFFFLLPN